MKIRKEFIYAKHKYPVRRGFCRVCRKPIVGDKRATVCGRECLGKLGAVPIDWQDAKLRVFKRDKGVCAACGCNTEKLRRILRLCNVWDEIGRTGLPIVVRRKMGFNPHGERLWDCDHIRSVAEHGPAETIDDLQTLCHPCHKAKTREQGAQRIPRPLFAEAAE